jgi:hypothetical protein
VISAVIDPLNIFSSLPQGLALRRRIKLVMWSAGGNKPLTRRQVLQFFQELAREARSGQKVVNHSRGKIAIG